VVRDAAAEYEPAASTVSLLTAPLVEPLGQVYQTYIVAVVDGALQLIDQHAAHERLLFDALMAQLSSDATLEAQPRLVPQTVALPADVVTLLAAHLPLLARMGLECEPFGRDALVIRSTPAVLAQAPLEPFLVDLADGWSAGAEWPEAAASRPGDGARAGQRRLLQAVAATIACHGAIKAHQPLGRREMSHLVEELHRRRVAPTCPHGRPVRVSFDRDQLEKLFYRR
jgi:DNA mismatch repair protein MutL